MFDLISYFLGTDILGFDFPFIAIFADVVLFILVRKLLLFVLEELFLIEEYFY